MAWFEKMTMEISESLSNKIANMGFVSSCLVVLLHIFPNCGDGSVLRVWDDFIACGPGRAAVPFFALISGLMLGRHSESPGWYKNEIRKRVSTLLVPFVIWNALFVVMGVRGYGVVASFKRCLGMFDPFLQPPCGPLWYLRSLMVFVLFSPLFIRIVRRFTWGVLLTLFFFSALLFIPGSSKFSIFVNFIHLEAMFYFVIGLAISVGRFDFNVGLKLRWWWALILAVILTLLRMRLKQEGCFAYFPLRAFVIPCWLIAIWKFIPTFRWSVRITACAFPIYLMHEFVFVVIRKLGVHMNAGEDYIVLAVAGILLPMVVVNFLPPNRLVCACFGGRVPNSRRR